MTILFTASLAEKYQHQLLKNFPDQTFIFKNEINQIEDHLPEAKVIVTYGSDLNETMIDQAKKLEWIMVFSAGLDQMPLQAIKDRDILVTNVRGIHKIPMAEYALSMLLYVYRQERTLTQNNLAKKWDKSLKMNELSGSTMLVVGAGAIGQEVARLGKAFHMKTLGLSRSGKTVEYFDENYPIHEINDVLPQADFIVSVLPSTSETRNLFTEKEFKQMQNHAVFLNMGRGDAVVEDDLLRAIQQREIAHAVLDVFVNEPLPDDHPFWEEKHITITPHISAQSDNYVPRSIDIFEKNLHTYLEGTTDYININDITRGY